MSKRSLFGKSSDIAETEVTETEVANAEAATPGKRGGKQVMITVNGESVSRVEYIRSRWTAGATRSEIAKELTELQGKVVPYQIVFAGTKGISGGPVKAPAESEGAAA